MKRHLLSALLLSLLFIACSKNTDNDPDLDYPNCTPAQRDLPATFTLNGFEQEPDTAMAVMLSSSDITLTRLIVREAESDYHYITIQAQVDEKHIAIISIEGYLDGVTTTTLTISTVDALVGTGEEINGNLYYAEGVSFQDLQLLDCMVEGRLQGTLPQVSPEEENGNFEYEIFFRALAN